MSERPAALAWSGGKDSSLAVASQVAAIGLPLVEATIPAAASNAIYEEAFAAALTEVTSRRFSEVR